MPGRGRGPGPGRGGARRRSRRQARKRVMLVGGMVAIGTKKMSAKNAQDIEAHTGVSPEEPEDADLQEAMQELGIPDEEVGPGDEESPS